MITTNDSFLDNSVIVAAHADDEILWFSSIMEHVDEVMIVFEDYWAHPDIGEKRAAAVSEIPHPNIRNLKISESGPYGSANWNNPVLSDVGIEFGLQAQLREAKRRFKRLAGMSSCTLAQSVASKYEENYSELYEILDEKLTPDMNVFTHNPWGEYGHEEHIQVFRVVDNLRRKKGFKLWISNYCTNRSLPLAMTYFVDDEVKYIKRPTNKKYAQAVADAYRRHDCWTWQDDWIWLDEECFMEAPKQQANAGPHARLFPLNMFAI